MKEVALEIALKDGWGFTVETMCSDVSWEGKSESKAVDIGCVQEAVGTCLEVGSRSSCHVN